MEIIALILIIFISMVILFIMFSVILGLLWLSVAMIMGEVTWSLMGIAFLTYMVFMLVFVLLFRW